MRKPGVKVWTCDVCGKQETWRKGWRYLPGVPSDANKHPTLIYPWAACSDVCEDRGLKRPPFTVGIEWGVDREVSP